MQFTIGADPELFLVNKEGKFISSVGLIGGTKEHPMPLPLGDGYAVLEDNVAVEFNIPACDTEVSFLKGIHSTVEFLRNSVKTFDLDFSELSAKAFDQDQLMTPAAQEFGCDPDFNAWRNGAVNERPKAEDSTLRSCGGHVHVGYDQEKVSHIHVVKLMDLFLGVPSVIMDKGELRKNLYGLPGAHRKKPYGVEYRTLSNFWIFKEDLIKWVYRNTARALKAADAQLVIDQEDEAMIVESITTNNKEMANYLINKHQLEVI